MILREINKAWAFFKEHGFRKSLLSRETPFLIQFGKYGASGVISVLAFLSVALCGEVLFPDSFSPEISSTLRMKNIFLLHLVAFLPANVVAYLLNRWLVFTPGRHTIKKEIILFGLVSFFSFSIGEFLPLWLVKTVNVPTIVANLSFVFSSALVNFVARKFLVFEK